MFSPVNSITSSLIGTCAWPVTCPRTREIFQFNKSRVSSSKNRTRPASCRPFNCHCPTSYIIEWNQPGVIMTFFLSPRSNRCTRCLLWIQRHVNLLQYRESMFLLLITNQSSSFSVLGECNDADDLLNATTCPNMIAPDAALYTLHRSEWADEVIL